MLANKTRSRREFARYCAASAVAFGADFALFNAGLVAGLGVFTAVAVGFALGVMVTYALSVRVVFTERALSDRRVEFGTFVGIGFGGLVLTEAVLWLLVGNAQWLPQLAKVVAAALTFLFNFGCRKTLLFTRRARQPAVDPS